MDTERRIGEILSFLYGRRECESIWSELRGRLESFRRRHPDLGVHAEEPEGRVTERDAFLILYGDQITEPGRVPLQTVADFLQTHLTGIINGVHLLPFFPYSSDDGFAITDFRQVDPRLGGWEDVEEIARRFRLMVDVVLNHVSGRHPWFESFKRGEAPYRDYFITVDPKADLSQVVRPRASPLLTPVVTPQGEKLVWTTFGPDQLDLNYRNPWVLLEMLAVILLYAARGARILRLDAAAYLWKEPGTPCIHLPQTHAVIKMIRAVLDAVAPSVMLLTETNVPHEENVRYFGDGTDEAQLVYNFALPPLVLHAFQAGDATRLTEWAAQLRTPPGTSFLNFLASHDGIGLLPARGLLTDDEIQALVDRTLEHGGLVSYRRRPDGGRDVYELNITFYDALNDPHCPDEERDIQRFIASQAIMLSLAGVPGIYIHGLLGSRNCMHRVRRTGEPRAINREGFERIRLEEELSDPDSLRSRVFEAYTHLLKIRRRRRAFHPFSEQQVLSPDERVFAVLRSDPQGQGVVLALINVSNKTRNIVWNLIESGLEADVFPKWHDLIADRTWITRDGKLKIPMGPYQVRWLEPSSSWNCERA
jgi:sucrose phosphorylase